MAESLNVDNSGGQGTAGDINVTSDFIRLDNQANIKAETTSSNGGNITLQAQNLLLLRRNSQISTNAGTAQAGGNGGNIIINIPNGFLVAVPNENSDITANAFNGRGGNINIKARAVFGIQRQEQQTPQSDITASSELGINGTVQINTPDVDPSNGLVELPTNLVDVSQQISTACTPGSRQFQNTFVSTGRGGIPHSPTEPLQDSTTLAQWVKLRSPVNAQTTQSSLNAGQDSRLPLGQRQSRSQPETRAKTTIEQPTAVSTAPKVATAKNQIVEATGWVVDVHGNIELVAQAPDVTPRSPWQTPTSCPVSQ